MGSVIVRDGDVVGAGHNSAMSDGDPANHAKVMAIRDACRKLGVSELEGATLYTAMEPCPMCAWAIRAVGIEQVVLGARHATFHRPQLGTYCIEGLMEMTGSELDVVTGLLEAECEALRPELIKRR